MPTRPTHVVILGCGRSGTSILGELFDALPGYTYHSEPAFDALRQLDYSTPQAIKVPRADPERTPTPGLSVDLHDLLEIVGPTVRIVWQIRHPLDAICSLRVGISQKWGHHPRPPDWTEWLDRPLLDRCAHHWRYINTDGFDAVQHLATLARFEDMIASPLATAEQMCGVVGVDAESLLVSTAITAWAQRVQDTNNADFVEAVTSRRHSRPDHVHRVGRWRENLTADEAAALWHDVGPVAERFGYRLSM